VNLPGHGGSAHVPAWDADTLARDLLAGPLADLACADWLGWSLGGQVALAAARQAPQRVRRLFLVGFNPCFVAREDWPEGQRPGFFREFRRACDRDPAGTMEQFLGLQLLGSERTRPTLRRLRELHGSAPPPGRESLLHGLDLLAETDQVRDLASIETPTLWLCGDRDSLTPPGAHRRAAALMREAGVRLVPGAGHAPFLSHEQALIDQLQAFRTARESA
jgi:pimeloyl-[acyl-carrier protein] methyl ester esterase